MSHGPVEPPKIDELGEWLDSHHVIVQGPEAGGGEPVHVFAQANGPIFGRSRFWFFNVYWLFWCFFWGLQGLIDLNTLFIDATLSIYFPILGSARLINVVGPLTGNGVSVTFNIGIVRGEARFYALHHWLWVQMTVFEFFRRPLPPAPVSRTVRLLQIPRAIPSVQFEST